jgi:hypothetical protein
VACSGGGRRRGKETKRRSAAVRLWRVGVSASRGADPDGDAVSRAQTRPDWPIGIATGARPLGQPLGADARRLVNAVASVLQGIRYGGIRCLWLARLFARRPSLFISAIDAESAWDRRSCHCDSLNRRTELKLSLGALVSRRRLPYSRSRRSSGLRKPASDVLRYTNRSIYHC